MHQSRRVKARVKTLKKQIRDILMSPVRFFYTLCFSIGFVVLVSIFSTSIYAYWFVSTLPKIETTSFNQLKVLAKKKVRKKFENKRTKHRWTAMRNINRDFVYTIVFSEDSTFFDHNGINNDALINALAENIKKRDYAFGASTITQQVAKNLYLRNEKSISRKLKEILITKELESHFTKNQILEIYLNIAEFGPDIFGVHAAAAHYYRKRPSQINAAEGAFIGLMLPSPRRNHYAIFQNGNLTTTKKRKIKRVLREMLYNEFISGKQYSRYNRYNFFKQRKRSLAGSKK